MTQYTINEEQLTRYAAHLQEQERAPQTIQKYIHDLNALQGYLAGKPLTKAALIGWKEHLTGIYATATVNSMLAAVNSFLAYMGWPDCHIKALRLQRQVFRDPAKELTREEYTRLVCAAETAGRTRLALLLETICATGIRVSEVKYITVEAVRAGRAEISLKGKVRVILLPAKLCRKLQKYAKKQKTASGAVFRTRSGRELSRKQIWAEMKSICKKAGVAASKVFPHNLRHVFARCFYRASRDIIKLADVLGHSSIETTRIYLLSTGTEHQRQLERLHLIR